MQASSSPSYYIFNFQYLILLGVVFLVSFIGLFIPIMDVDASQYASMSIELLQSKSYLQLTDLYEPYLDKPPLLFWLSSLSIKLLGNSSLAYKLPSFLMAWASVYFLYRLCMLYYNKDQSKIAALIYASSVAFILFTNDIRTDTLLISFVVLAVWQGASFLEQAKTSQLIFFSLALGFAMLAKGPIGALVPFMALLPHLLLNKKLKNILSFKILLFPLLVVLVLSPMLIGLYQQWGMQGIRFFFWEQSFGRITGENVWKNDASYFYFLHNIAWAFVPFTLFLLGGLALSFYKFKAKVEFIGLFGFILPFIALSFSHYKLPHYIYIVVPFAAMLSLNAIDYFLANEKKVLDMLSYTFQGLIIFALCLFPLIFLYAFEASFLFYSIYVSGIIGFLYTLIIRRKYAKELLLFMSFYSFIMATFFLNSLAYPSLLNYQSSSELAFYFDEHELPKEQLVQHQIYSRALNYYAGFIVPSFDEELLKEGENNFVFTTKEGKIALEQSYETSIIDSFAQFKVTRLSLNFLNPNTRKNTLSYNYLIQIQP